MLDYQKRVVTEKKELDEKLAKLDKFLLGAIFDGLSVYEQARMNRQAVAMKTYSEILGERIDDFGDE